MHEPQMDALFQRWVHSREEDTNTEKVYRPANYPLPPTRGRTGFEFSRDGRFKRIGIGRTDVAKVTEGTWNLAGTDPIQVQLDTDDAHEMMSIDSLDNDRLVIRKDQ